MHQEKPSHRHPTCSKKQLASATVQLEQKQMTEHLPATFNFSDVNAANPPNQLKHNKLIQGPCKEKWLQGMSNELGRLTQGFGAVRGKNDFSSCQRRACHIMKQLLTLEQHVLHDLT